MKKIVRALVILLAVYLAASLAASALVTFSSNIDLQRFIVNNRFGLLVMEVTETDLVIFSPFNNCCDVFLLGIDWEDGLRFFSDGLYGFGKW